MTASEDYYTRALRVSPGGVHSPVRSFDAVGGTPLFMREARGAVITDVDGKPYTDFCMAFGPLILGHRDPDVFEAVQAALGRGWSYGTAETVSLELAELITSRIPWVESLRFVNSGTEAVMSALRLARGATGRTLLLKFDGCYHGHADSMLIRAGSGLAGQSDTSSAGIPAGVAQDTLVAQLDDEAGITSLFAQHGNNIAAAIIEPLPANHGLLPQRDAFMHTLAKLCSKHGSLLIFDEVISGFRSAFGGYAEVCGIRPDLVTYGKIIGGGFPVGAYGGRRDLMEQMAPGGSIYQAGTLSANPVTMTAGLATLRKLQNGNIYAALDKLSQQLAAGCAGNSGVSVTTSGSIFWLCTPPPDNNPVRSPAYIPAQVASSYATLFHQLLGNNIYLPPGAFEVGFLSAAHSHEHIEQLITAIN